MGVVESARKIGEGEMRLQEMTIEEGAEKKPHFDARELISDEEWQEMLEFSVPDAIGGPITNRSMEFHMAIIFPDRISEIQKISFDLPNGTKLENRREEMAEYPLRGAFRTIGEVWAPRELHHLDLTFAANMKQIFPNGEMFQDLEGDARPYLETTLELLKTRRPPFATIGELISGLAELKILKPDSDPENLITWEELAKYLEELEQQKLMLPMRNIDSSKDYLYVARLAKILFPNKMKDYKIKPEIWQSAEECLEFDQQHKNWVSFVELASTMQILAADKVYVDETGLHLVMREAHDFQENAPDRPVRKSF